MGKHDAAWRAEIERDRQRVEPAPPAPPAPPPMQLEPVPVLAPDSEGAVLSSTPPALLAFGVSLGLVCLLARKRSR